MFQSVAENITHNENIKRNSKMWLFIKELFRPQNVFIYILTFLVSMIDINGAYIPLGLAMLSSAIRKYCSSNNCIYM